LKPFGCTILGNDILPHLEWSKENNIPLIPLKELLKKSDIICIHVSYLPQNKHLINNTVFRQMKKGVLFINCSRGPIVDETALVQHLKNGRVQAAALDVFEQEPYQGPLIKFPNVILTPHIGGSTKESRYLMQLGAIENLVEELEK
jgi:D-3-phosphoglycerate dehydrogenase